MEEFINDLLNRFCKATSENGMIMNADLEIARKCSIVCIEEMQDNNCLKHDMEFYESALEELKRIDFIIPHFFIKKINN